MLNAAPSRLKAKCSQATTANAVAGPETRSIADCRASADAGGKSPAKGVSDRPQVLSGGGAEV